LDDEARQDLSKASDLLVKGDWRAAEAAFDRIGATHPAAEPYARVMSIVANSHATTHGTTEELARIAADLDAPLAARRAAAAYRGLDFSNRGAHAEAARTVHELHPGEQPSWLVLPRDRVTAMILLAQGAVAQGDLHRAVRALSWAFQLGDQDERVFARDRCADMLRETSPAALDELAVSDDDFIRGLAGAAIVRRGMMTETTDDELATMRKVFQSAAPALVRIGAGHEAEFLAARLEAATGPKPIRIGVLLPLSGRARGVGSRALGGVLLAQGAMTPASDPQSTLIIEDTASSLQGAVRGVEELHRRGVAVIIGPLDDREASAAATRAEALDVPLIALTLDAGVVSLGDEVFRLFIHSKREVEELIARAAALGVQRLGIAHPDGRLGRGLAAAATRAALDHRIAVLETISYDPTTHDHALLARTFGRANIDAIFIPDVASRVSVILPFLAAEDLWCMPPGTALPDNDRRRAMVCLGNVLWHDPTLLRDGGTYANGAIIVAGWSPLTTTEENNQFVSEHRGTMGREPDVFAAFAYDAVKIARALTIGGHSTPGSFRDELSRLRSFPGLSGPVAATATGELTHETTWLTVKDGAFQLLEDQ
jgi:branched-chain amino acid transport system substrate-binding protein